MRLEMVDGVMLTVDDISVTDMVREQKYPPVREFGEVDAKYTIQNNSDPESPQKRYEKQTKEIRQKLKWI